MIRLRIAEASDVGRLIEFIRDHWSSTHVFTERPEVFTWQYGQDDGRLNMVLAESDGAGTPVLGVLGFIPLGRFSPSLGDRDVMLAIWKVRDDGVAPPGLGLRLLKFLQAELSPRLIAAVGTSQIVRPIYEVLGYTVGSLYHGAVFSPARRGALRVASGAPDAAFEPSGGPSDVRFQDVTTSAPTAVRDALDRLAGSGCPAKNWAYLEQRYLRHPWYRYRLSAAHRAGDLVGGMVVRAVEARGTRVLRIVDLIGDPAWLVDARAALQSEVVTEDAEYIDLMQYGLDDETVRSAGFVSRSDSDELVIPNYFAPFEARNIEIELAYKVLDGSDGPVRLFRADSDQDRPNLPSEIDTTV